MDHTRQRSCHGARMDQAQATPQQIRAAGQSFRIPGRNDASRQRRLRELPQGPA